MIDVHFKPNPPSNAAEAAHMDTAEIYKQKAEHFVCRIRPWPMRAPWGLFQVAPTMSWS